MVAGLFSFVINGLLLVSPVYMLQVYDRVLSSGSEATLLALTIVAVGLLGVMAILHLFRARILVRIGARLDQMLSDRLFAAVFDRQLKRPQIQRAQPLNDLNTLRQFITGQGLFAFFDVPWTPMFLIVLYLIHPFLGTIAAIGGLVLLILTVLNEMVTRRRIGRASGEQIAASSFAETSLRNAEALEAMGMLGGVSRRWHDRHRRMLAYQAQASDAAGVLVSLIKFVRVVIQTLMLGGGALLAIQGIISPGFMIAGSIIAGRALAPIEQAVGSWSGFVSARLAFYRIEELLASFPPTPQGMDLPPPVGKVSFESVVAVPPGGTAPTLRGISFEIQPGEVIGVVGPSAAGKSTLARLITGVWQPFSGKVRIDGADLLTWPRARIGPSIGYLPQDIELFDGTIAENIARFGTVDPPRVIEAARNAGVHEMILALPRGYDTQIGDGGSQLSGGQKQRMGLARALFGDPAILVFDEPNSNLDEEGEACLIEAIRRLKDAGRTIVIIAHKPSVLVHVDKVMVMRDGVMVMFGPRADVMARVTRPVLAAVGQPAHQGTG